MDFFISK